MSNTPCHDSRVLQTETPARSRTPYETPPWTQVIAHRGNSGPIPENTLAAIDSAIELRVDMVEVDMRLTRGGVPILMHNDRVDRKTSGTGMVTDLTWDKLKTLDGGSWRGPEFAGETVEALDEVLDLARGRVALNLDIKVPEAAKPTAIAVIEARAPASVVIRGCTANCVRTVGDTANGIATLFNSDELLATNWPERMLPLARDRISRLGINR